MIKCICQNCNKEFSVHPYRKDMAKFCSRKCSDQSKKGCPAPKTAFKKGCTPPKTAFKKGFSPWNKGTKGICKAWNKGKKCPQFTGYNHGMWKGGRITKRGYILISQTPYDGKSKYTYRSRLVAEKFLGRVLKKEERVHHINEIVDDDRIENFIIFKNQGYHCVFHRYGYYNPKGVIFDGRTLLL